VPCLLERTLLRVSGGFVKLLFPDKSFSRGELELVVDLALPSLDWMRPYK
jgi:predicted ATP-dependent Lon-type protease